MNISGSFVGSRSPKTVDLFYQARLVRITHGRFTIWLDPFEVLNPKVVVNLLPKLHVSMDQQHLFSWMEARGESGDRAKRCLIEG